MTKRFNVIDILIIAVAVLAIAAVFFGTRRNAPDETQEGVVLVTMEIAETHEGLWRSVTVGDKVTEKVEKKEIGKISAVSVKPAQKASYDRRTGEPEIITLPEREDIYITMELDKGADVAVGKPLSIVTKHFAGHGYVTRIEDNQ